MSIRFICTCGKHLRARDEMAARRTVCPACGRPVGIPSTEPTQRGAPIGPLTPQERQAYQAPPAAELLYRTVAREISEAIEPRPADLLFHTKAVEVESTRSQPTGPIPFAEPPLPGPARESRPRLSRLPVLLDRKPLPRPRQRPPDPWFLGADWYMCLLYPLGALPLFFRLSLLLALVTVIGVRAWPDVVEDVRNALVFLVCFPLALVPLLPFGFAASFLEGVFAFAARGEARNTAWPERNLGMALKSALVWLVCFLAGPAILVSGAVIFWLHFGDPAIVDWLILGELVFLASAWWLFALVTVFEGGRLADVRPPRVARLIRRLGYRAGIAAVLAFGLLCAHGWLLLRGLEETHEQVVAGFLLVQLAWFSLLYTGTFLFRFVGLGLYQVEAQAAEKEANTRSRSASGRTASLREALDAHPGS